MVNISSQLVSTKAKHGYRKALYKIETPPSSGIASSDDSESGSGGGGGCGGGEERSLSKQNTDSSLIKLTSTAKSTSSSLAIRRENSKSLNNMAYQKYTCSLNASSRDDERVPKMSVGSRRIMGCSDVVSIKSCSSSSSKRVSSQATHSAKNQLIENSSLNFLGGDYDNEIGLFKDKSTESGKIDTMTMMMSLEKKYTVMDLEMDEGGYEIVYDSKIDDAIRIQSLSSSHIDSNSSSTNAKNDSITK
jgi:hypothetical protein